MTAPIGHNGPPSEGEVSLDKEGWIAIARAMRDHWLVGFGQPVTPVDEDRGSFSRSEAWIDLIMECRYSAGTVNNGGRKMELRPGQLLGAVSWLASRWNWTPKTVRGFLDKLEEEGMIERFTPGIHPGSDDVLNGHQKGKQKGKQAAVLTVCKYSIYQLADRLKGQAKGSSEGMQGASRGHAEGNIYKEETREQGNKGTNRPAPEPAAEGLAGLNGCTEPMIADVMRWMNISDEKSARKWLSSTVAIYGQDATKDAWIKLGTDIATGSVIAQPLATWAKIATRMRDERKAAPPTTKRDEEMRKLHALTVRR
jgi:DNA-binding Lrp family transcriptional regulator